MWSDSNYYTWKIETDEFQPEGLTRKIELQIPYGLDRKLEFITNNSSGLVKVDDGENVEILDLYSKDKDSIKINLLSTSRNTMYAVKLYVFILWLFIFCVFLKLFQLKIENKLTFFDKFELSTRKFLENKIDLEQKAFKSKTMEIFRNVFTFIFGYLAMNTIFYPSEGYLNYNWGRYYQSSIMLLIVFMFLCKYHKNIFKFVDSLSLKNKKSIINFSIVVIIVLQLIVVLKAGYTGPITDFRNVMLNVYNLIDLEEVRNGEITGVLYMYQNNLGITYMFTMIFRIMGITTDTSFEKLYHITVMINILLTNISIQILMHMTKKYTSMTLTVFLSVLMIFISPFYTFMSYVYTETIGIFFSIFSFFLYDRYRCCEKQVLKYTYFILAVSSCVVGFGIKSHICILLIAILIHMFYDMDIFDYFKKGIMFFVFVIFVSITYNDIIPTVKNPNFAMPSSNWIAMGLNSSTDFHGNGYYHSDASESSDWRTKYNSEYANEQNWKKIKERLDDFGIDGYFEFLERKLRLTWNDGIYGVIIKTAKDPASPDSLVYRSIVEDNTIFVLISQIGHIVLLFGIFLGGLHSKYTKPNIATLGQINIFGILIFHLIWESRSRYLVHLIPIMLFVSMYGYYSYFNKIKEEYNIKNKEEQF